MSEYVNTRQVMQRFGWTTRAMVSLVALREGWERKIGSRPRQYCLSDVERYALDRLHTEQAKRNGYKLRGLLRHNARDYSSICPICNLTKLQGAIQ